MRRHLASVLLALGLIASTSAPATASAFPSTIRLPDGFQPEGILTGPGPFAYVTSMADGSIYRADLRTGRGAMFSRGPGTPSLGLHADGHGHLFVAGGTGGDLRIVDARTGRVLASDRLTTGPAFVNDIAFCQGAAWITDSTNPVLYKVPLRGDRMPGPPVRIPLTGEMKYGSGFNANGITPTPDGRGLLVVQSNTGDLFRVEPSGATRRVNLHGETLVEGDGLLLRGRTLYAVQNRWNAVAVLRLNAEGTEGHVVRRLRDERFDVPSTVMAFGSRLYLPNARFDTTPTPETPYTVVAIPRR
ncbi:SMP-30/gluconolactonase/LRE family protein [Actinoallomurus rhizosphaericola]|uniref:SMP-30/gluconolactonase/LRE family protein n=1 Tax=Actinoallomurus rhizosphaericola TaxID=2952536 RepID=UPI002090FC89|nr:superoxide dismutase [Actinoallomurus rhizosphaericola]MCO5992503.1 superoxide dismutase [Actinoallomurus rhizosphaericola]